MMGRLVGGVSLGAAFDGGVSLEHCKG